MIWRDVCEGNVCLKLTKARAVLSYWARRYDSAICCSKMSIFGHLPSCSV